MNSVAYLVDEEMHHVYDHIKKKLESVVADLMDELNRETQDYRDLAMDNQELRIRTEYSIAGYLGLKMIYMT